MCMCMCMCVCVCVCVCVCAHLLTNVCLCVFMSECVRVKALEKETDTHIRALLLSNRSAALANLARFHNALQDADRYTPVFVLQCVAVCCSVLHCAVCVAACCNVFRQCPPRCRSVHSQDTPMYARKLTFTHPHINACVHKHIFSISLLLSFSF